MNKKLFFSVIPVMVLVFGMTVVGCDNDTTNSSLDSALFGTWFSSYYGGWTFYPNGTCRLAGDGETFDGIWSSSSGILTVAFYIGRTQIFSYTVFGNFLYLNGNGPYVKQ